MSHRRSPSVAFLVAALLLVVTGLVASPQANAAATAKAGNPRPAIPNGPKSVFPLDRFGPRPDDNVALKWSEETLGMIRSSALPPTAVSAMGIAFAPSLRRLLAPGANAARAGVVSRLMTRA